jgi:hypothetical protein
MHVVPLDLHVRTPIILFIRHCFHISRQASILVYLTASDPFEFAQLDLSNSDVKSSTRVACIQFNIAELRELYLDEDHAYELLAEWVVAGPAAGSGLFHLQRHDDLPGQFLPSFSDVC